MAATSPEASIRLAESKVSSCLKPTASWDAAKGVWVGDHAMGEEPPRPLVVFGYGSLCWRPDTTLGDFDSFPCILRGWTRLFCQRSTDHRGTPEAPGLVVTLCETPTLAVLPGFESETVPDRVLGRAYIVPNALADGVVKELDFREKGGYSRRVVDVERLDGQGSEVVRALLYSGSVENPNFWWGDDGSGLNLDRAASIIATAHGPSGPNVDYLRNLADFLREQGHVDKHIAELERRVDAIKTQNE